MIRIVYPKILNLPSGKHAAGQELIKTSKKTCLELLAKAASFMRVFGASAALCAAVASAASAEPVTYSMASTTYRDFGSGPLSVSGNFTYDAVANVVSAVNISFNLDGVTTKITKAAPNTPDGYLVLTNQVAEDQPVLFIASGPFGSVPNNVLTLAGLCGPLHPGPTCNTLRYSVNLVSFVPGPINTPPLADAGPDQTVASGVNVLLDGTASSDAESDPLTYSWTQTAGPAVMLSNPTAVQPIFMAPTLAVGDPPVDLFFSLTANDGTAASAADTVTITVNAPTVVPPDAPTNLVATAGDGQVSVAFTAPSGAGASAITDYEYQLNGGTWVSAGTTASPVVIPGLTNGVSYVLALRAVNAAGEGAVSQPSFVTLVTTADAPTNLVATAGDGQVSVAFTSPAYTGGGAITDYEYQLNGGTWVSAGTTASPVVIPGLTNGTSYSIALRAVNPAGKGVASASVSVSLNMPSPASEFADNEAAIRQVIEDEAVRNLQSTIAANQRMARDARERVIAEQSNEDPGTEAGNVPFDVDGGLDVNGTTISSKGTFHGAQSLGDGTRRLVFGDFDVRHDGETGSSTATLTGRMAWERMVSAKMLLGYFIGGELARSNIAGAFAGDQNRVGVTAGGYAVHELAKNTYLDGFLTFGAGRNNLEMANDVLALSSDYTTRSVTFGGALSSVIEKPGYEIWPELSFSYGRTWIGDMGFTGAAYGLVDNALSLDAGSVTLANIMFRPEFRVAMDGLSGADSLQLFTFAPRLICEQVKATVTEENCGGGVEFGFTGQSVDGMSNYSAKLIVDRFSDQTSSVLQLNLEHKF